MKLKKTIALLMAAAMVMSAAAFATAETAETEEPAAETVYTPEEMMTLAMTDAYNRQTAYTAYAEAFPDNKSFTNNSMETQIVLLEMLLKANSIALPVSDAQIAVPETAADTYAAITDAEDAAVKLYRSFLQQENIPEDAKIVFRSVLQMTRHNRAAFAQRAQFSQRVQQLQELRDDENTQVYVLHRDGRRGSEVIYIVKSTEPADTEDMQSDEVMTDTVTENSTGE